MILKLRAFLLLLAIAGSTAVNAADSDISETHKSKLASITNTQLGYYYEIQPDTSTIEFRVDSPVGEVWASFHDFNGRFSIPASGVSSDSAIVDINADSLDTNAGFIEKMLKSEIFFDVERFPSMQFVGSSFEWFNKTNAVLKGELTIQEITRPVAFYVELVNTAAGNKYAERITVRVTTTIKRSEFGIYTLLPVVSDNVNLIMTIDAIKKATTLSML